MTDKQQSPNWDKYCNVISFVEEGFPFNEGFPKGGPYGNANKTYELILRDGERVNARVDYSTQYRDEGLQWRANNGRNHSRSIVLGWREL